MLRNRIVACKLMYVVELASLFVTYCIQIDFVKMSLKELYYKQVKQICEDETAKDILQKKSWNVVPTLMYVSSFLLSRPYVKYRVVSHREMFWSIDDFSWWGPVTSVSISHVQLITWKKFQHFCKGMTNEEEGEATTRYSASVWIFYAARFYFENIPSLMPRSQGTYMRIRRRKRKRKKKTVGVRSKEITLVSTHAAAAAETTRLPGWLASK